MSGTQPVRGSAGASDQEFNEGDGSHGAANAEPTAKSKGDGHDRSKANAGHTANPEKGKGSKGSRVGATGSSRSKADGGNGTASRSKRTPSSSTKSSNAPKSTASGRATTSNTASSKSTSSPLGIAGLPKASGEDDLKMISGIGPTNEKRLKEAGIMSFAQIAAMTPDQQREVGERLSFPGRMEREDWVGQARILAEGGSTDFSQRVASGGVRSSLASDDPRYRE